MEAKVFEYKIDNELLKKEDGMWERLVGYFKGAKDNRELSPSHVPIDKTMWVPDEKAPTCYNCQKQFSAIFLRKHHCRICGNVFCKDCSSKTVEGKYWGSKKEIKVCDYCHEMYKKLDETLVETTIDNPYNLIEDIDSIEDNVKNLKRETKLSEYCKKYKKETEEYYKFLQMDKKYEEGIKQNLENFYDQLVKHVIEIVLRNENLYEKWFDKIYDLTKKTISQVNPSFKDLKDSLNINDYVKIKNIPYKDQSLCKVIDGFAFKKNVSSKKMNTNIENPKILLLDCGLDYNRNKDNITNFENLMTLEPAYFNIILKKIELVEPTVILVHQNVSRKIQETLAISNKVSLVMNVKSKSLRKIARCTKTYVLPSTDLIDQQTILGTCKKFKIEKIKTFNSSKKNDLLKANEFNLMTFEGCDYVLYATILLSGPDEKELKLLKGCMRTILLTVRDLYLQKTFLYFSYCDYPDINEVKDEIISRISISSSMNSSVSGMSISNTSQNVFLHKHLPHQTASQVLRHNLLNVTPTNEMREFLNGFDTCIFYEKTRVFNVVKLTISQGSAVQINSLEKFFSSFPNDKASTNGQPGGFNNANNNQQDLAESEVLKKVNSVCEEPQDLELIFYSEKEFYDKPLGKLIIDMCYEADTKCDVCKKMKSAHIYYIYNKMGRLKIEMIQNQSDPNDNIEQIMEWINRESTDFSKYNNFYKSEKYISNKCVVNYNIDIFSYGVCNICQHIVTPLIKLPREIFNFSVAMFFKFMLFNHELINRSDKRDFNLTKQSIANNNCSHYVNRDINRIFITKMGTIKFSYEDSRLYIIETSPMNERSDNKYFNIILETFLLNARERSIDVLMSLSSNFKFYLEHLKEISSFLSIENMLSSSHCASINEDLEKLSKIINKYMNVTNEINSFVESLFTIPPKFEDYVKAIVYIKRVYFRIVQVKIVQNHVRKLVNKLKSTINYLVKMKVISQQFERADKESTNSNNMNMNMNSISISLNTLPLDIENSANSSFDNIDSKEAYRSILKEISSFDESHNKYSSEWSEEDLSSIIAYTLTSDKYREFISPNNRFKLIEIKCERKNKSPFDCMQYIKDSGKKEFKGMFDVPGKSTMSATEHSQEHGGENKYGYNFFTTQDEEVYETSLLFDQSKNTYQYQNLDNHKIYQQLETELLSDEKKPFEYKPTEMNIMSNLCSSNLPIEFVRKNHVNVSAISSLSGNQSISNNNPSSRLTRQKSVVDLSFSKESSEKLNYVGEKEHAESLDEKIILQGDNIKATFEEIDQIKKDLKGLKESYNQIVDNKTKTKYKKYESLEESILVPLEYEVNVYYPRQFEALRITYCATYDEFILSIAKSSVWSNVTGGKSKADFYKSHDNKFILKCVNKHEFKMFIETGFQYFHHNAKFLFHKMPSALAKILGAYKVTIKNNKLNKVENSYIILMENLFYGKDMNGIKAYDLKGSKSNRYIPKKDQKPNQVLPDTNFKEDFKGEPIALERNMCDLLKAAVHNDSLILSKMNVVDYSLLLIIDEKCNNNNISILNHNSGNRDHPSACPICYIKSIRVGIIDYVRKYTWDKQLEHVGKIIINRLQVPTIVNPVNYKERFKEAIDDFFIGL